MTPLKTIAEELACCRQAFADNPAATHAYNVHHTVVCEKLEEPIENRIAYILSDKPVEEQACRFRNMRPVVDQQAMTAAWAECERVRAPAGAEYARVRATALAEYNRVHAPARAEYNRVCAAAGAEYERVHAPAWAECNRACAAAGAEYDRVRIPALAEYNQFIAIQHNLEWPDNSWNGKSIFN